MDSKLLGFIKAMVLLGKKHKLLKYPIVALLLTMGVAYDGISATKSFVHCRVTQIKELFSKKQIQRQAIKKLDLIRFKNKPLIDTPKIALNFVCMLKQITRQRVMAGVLSACLIFGLFPTAVFANEDVNNGNVIPSGTDTCVCATLCTESAANMQCPLCDKPEADLTLCLGKAPKQESQEQEQPPAQESEPEAALPASSDENTVESGSEVVTKNTVNVAAIDDAKYTSLSDAVSAAAAGDKIILTADDVATQAIEISKNLSIELNGHNLPETTFKLTRGKISISDSKGTGIINSNATTGFKASENYRCYASLYVTGEAQVTLNNLRIQASAENDLDKSIFLGGSGTLTINGGAYTGPKEPGCDALYFYNNSNATLIINDGHFEANCGLSVESDPNTANLQIRKARFVGNGTAFWIEGNGNGAVSSLEKAKEFLDESISHIVGEFKQADIIIGSGLFVSDGFKEPENGSANAETPAKLTPTDGESVTLAPQILGGNGDTSTLEYQWTKDITPLPGATQPTYTIDSYKPAEDDGAYTVKVTDPALPEKSIEIFWQVGDGSGSGGTTDGHAHTTILASNGSPLAAGSYYLDEDMTTDTVTALATIGDSVVNLCLNGHKLNGKIQCYGTSTLNLYDCSENKTGEIFSNTAKDNVYVIDNQGTGDVNIFGGSVTSRGDTDLDAVNNATGTAIWNSSTGNINIKDGNIATVGANSGDTIHNSSTGKVNISGGTVSNAGNAKNSGPVAAIINFGNGDVNITGGTVTASGSGGLVVHNCEEGTVNISGDETKVAFEGTPDRFGEAIRNLNAGTINISGGTISAKGRQVWTIYNVRAGKVNVTGGTVVSSSTDNDGCVSDSNGTITFSPNVVISPEGAMNPATKLTHTASTTTAEITNGQASYTLSGGSDPAPSNWLVYSASIDNTLAKDVTATLSGNTLTLSGTGLKAGKYYISAYDRANGKGASKLETSSARLELTTTLPAIETSIKINGSAYTGKHDTLAEAVTASNVTAADITSLEILTGRVTGDDWKAIKTTAPKLQTLIINEAVAVADIPDGTKILKDMIFPTTIQSVTIPQSIKIGNYAFYNCKSLINADISNVTALGEGTFQGCSALTSISLPKLTTVGISAFSSCSLLSVIDMPLLTTIEESAFSSCKALTSVSFPKVTTIGKSAFAYCTSLKEATFDLLTETTGGFNDCTALEKFTAPKLTVIGNGMFQRCGALIEVNTEAVEKIGSSAFLDCAKLNFPKFPNVIAIENAAFQGCNSFVNVNLPKVETLGNYVFFSTDYNECDKLISASMPMIKSMGNSVFTKHLTTLFLSTTPPTVTSGTFKNGGTIYFIDENGEPLLGGALTTAHNKYKEVDDGSTTDALWYKWQLGAPEASWKAVNNSAKGIGTLYDSLKAVSKTGGTVTVLDDCDYTSGTPALEFTSTDNGTEIGLTANVTLDLAGHSLSYPKMSNQPFRLESNTGKLTVTDKSTGKTGKITTKSNAVFMCLDNSPLELTGGTYVVENADPFGAVCYFSSEPVTADVLSAGLKRIVPSGYLFEPADIIIEDYAYTASTAPSVKVVADVMAPMPENVKVKRGNDYQKPVISWDAVEGDTPQYTVTLYSIAGDAWTEVSEETTAETSLSWGTPLTEGTRYGFGIIAKVSDKEFASAEARSRVYNCAANPTAPGGALDDPPTQESVDNVFGDGNATLDGDKIIINNDITVEGTITISPDITIDLNGNTLTGKDEVSSVITVTSPADVTIKGPGEIIGGNGTGANNGGDAINGSGNVIINGGANITGGNGTGTGNGGDGIDLSGNGDITVDNGSVTGGTGTTGGTGATTGETGTTTGGGNITVGTGGSVTGGTGTTTGGTGATTDSGHITVDKGGSVTGGSVTGGTGATTGGAGATTDSGNITVGTGGSVTGGSVTGDTGSTGGTGATTGGAGATTGSGHITVDTGGSVTGGAGANGGNGGAGTSTGDAGSTTVNGNVTGGSGGDNSGAGADGGTGGTGAIEDDAIGGTGTITGGSGGNITEAGTGNPGAGGAAITGNENFGGTATDGGKGVTANASVDVKPNTPTVKAPKQELINGAVTDIERVDDTIDKIDVTLTVAKNNAPTDQSTVDDEVASGQKVGIYLDITLEKIITKNNSTQSSETVTEATQPITITVTIPENMRGGSDYKIIRVHGGTAETIMPRHDTTKNSLSFKTNKFSTYAIAYTPSGATQPDNTPPPYYGNTTTGGGSSAPTEQEPSLPSNGTANITGNADNKGNATITITDKAISDAIKNAEGIALKNGSTNAKFTLSFNSNGGNSKSNSVTVNLPKSVQEKIIANSISNTVIAVSNPQIKISLNLATVKEIYRQAGADVNITATKQSNSKLTGNAKSAIASRPVYSFEISYGKDKKLENLGANAVIVTLPYLAQKNETAGGLIAAYVSDNKTLTYITKSSYDKDDKVMRFALSKPSVCAIAYKAPSAFKDISNSPVKEDIDFATARGLLGQTTSAFYPDGAITRGAFITALGKLADVNVNNYKSVKLTDIKPEDYYSPYAEWATQSGILSGTSFGPYVAMSRQTMAVIMTNYAKTIGFTLPSAHKENFFDDKTAVSYTAADSVKQLQMAGILLGKDENKLDPNGTATRSEFYAMLHNLTNLMLEEDTAQGFKQNDSGSFMYFENGNALKNQTKTISGKAYSFDSYGITTDYAQQEAVSNTILGYTVKSGDSFWSIAKENNVNMNTLLNANSMTISSVIHPGDVLTMPS